MAYSEKLLKYKSLLTLSRRRPMSYRNQSFDLLRKSMDWFLYDIGLRHERVKRRNGYKRIKSKIFQHKCGISRNVVKPNRE